MSNLHSSIWNRGGNFKEMKPSFNYGEKIKEWELTYLKRNIAYASMHLYTPPCPNKTLFTCFLREQVFIFIFIFYAFKFTLLGTYIDI